MEISKVLTDYFNFKDIKEAFSRETTVRKVALAALKVFSYFTIAIPIVAGVVYALTGRVKKTDSSFSNQAKKVADLSQMHFYIIGGGIAGLNTALLLIKHKVSGRQITILEAGKECGGLFYRNVSKGGAAFFAHTVRTFDEPSYKYTEQAWREAGIWKEKHLISRNLAEPRETIPSQMRKTFFSIVTKSDEELERMAIQDLLPQDILKSPAFRYFFHLTGLFEHHSALALKRYMTHTHSHIPHNWVLRSASCDYESIVEPIVAFLQKEGVEISTEKQVEKLVIRDNHVQAIDELQLKPQDKVIATLGANVLKSLFSNPEDTLLYDTTTPISPDTPLETSVRQPHSSVWLLAHEELALQIEGRFLGSHVRDFIHIDVEHPWQITFISLGNAYYKEQPKNFRLFYIAMNDLSKQGLHINQAGTKCTEEELAEEVLKRLNVWDVLKSAPEKYTATVDTRARQFLERDSAPIVRFMPNEAQNGLIFPDTACDNLAVIGERVRAYQAPVPTTEWVTETGYRAIQYLIKGERYRMTPQEYRSQERQHSLRFVWSWLKYKTGVGGPSFVSTIEKPLQS